MKKLIFISLLLLLAMSTPILKAQENDTTNKLDSIINKTTKQVFQYDSIGNNIIEIISKRTNPQSQWMDSIKFEYYYDSNKNKTFRFSYKWNINQLEWIYLYKYEYVYNSDGLKTMLLLSKWDTTQLQWLNDEKTDYFYDTNDNMISHITSVWSTSLQQYKNYKKNEYTYYPDGNQESYTSFTWDNNLSQWTNYGKHEYSYDSNGNLILDVNLFWYDSQWKNGSKKEYTYDNNGNLINCINYGYNHGESQWTYSSKNENFYDSNSNVILQLNTTWNGNQWVNSNKMEYTYDSNILPSELIFPLDYSFTSQLLSYVDSTWSCDDFGFGNWVDNNSTNYYWSEIQLSNLEKIESLLDIYIYPNPAKDKINIFCQQKLNRIEIIDLLGKVIYQGNDRTIDISNYIRGTYFIKIQLDKGVITKKIIVN